MSQLAATQQPLGEAGTGLAASLWARDLHAAITLVSRLEAGTVWVNTHNLIDRAMPFGGMMQSGRGRDIGSDGLHAYTETKAVCISL